MAAKQEEVVSLDFWASPYGMRARIALAEKGIHHVSIDEDLGNKSELLLNMNPVHKTIPVLLHNNKPVCESLIILQYIDEVWNDSSPFLPSDPYQRAQARFWADFVDNKIYEIGRKILAKKAGEEREAAKKEYIENLNLVLDQLGEKLYFGGDSFGYVDIALIPIYIWFYAFEMARDVKFEESCPKITAWAQRCMQRDSVSRSLPDHHKIYEYVLMLETHNRLIKE